jgi:hypothetical protein
MALKRPREKTIDVKATKTGAGACDVKFEVDASDLKFKNDTGGVPRPGYILYFDIEEPAGVDSRFHSSDPLWVEPFNTGTTAPCPSSPAYWDQFEVIGRINNGKTLMVRNKNDFEQLFSFTLRFEVAGCNRVLLCDPIGSNQNGQQL